ncbi:shikimate dehydrogenase family protein [Cupriavidus pinatubonensis]|uniref:shikimate dehydrogenase family protein n=1 Tax=Cupriavidus pinatubonensis TaxID=248026 RepID=UPI001CC3FE4C|nr:shikimate dehydrogenase [Cupriavidus pinatubonensis]
MNGKTQVIVLMAWPSTHVRTPAFFNRLCAENGINAVMVPWAVRPENLQGAWDGLRYVENLAGVVLTIPHKTNAASLCDTLEEDAAILNVVNTVRRNEDGTYTGRMYDGRGFVEGMLNHDIVLEGKRVLLIGAGGAAAAIGLSLARQGVKELTIANRSTEKSRKLSQLVGQAMPQVSTKPGSSDPRGHDVVINATSLGLKPDDALPCDVSLLERGTVVADVVMQPPVTAFLSAAKEHGARIHTGEKMVTTQLQLFVDFLLDGGRRGQ